MRKGDFKRTTVQLPPDISAWLDRESEKNMSSLNSEIVRALRQKIDAETRTAA